MDSCRPHRSHPHILCPHHESSMSRRPLHTGARTCSPSSSLPILLFLPPSPKTFSTETAASTTYAFRQMPRHSPCPFSIHLGSTKAFHGDYRCIWALFEAWLVATASLRWEEHGYGFRILIRSTSWDIESKFYRNKKLLTMITNVYELCLMRGWELRLRFIERNTVVVSDFWYNQRVERSSRKRWN